MNGGESEKLYQESIKLIKTYQHPNGGFYASPPENRYPYIYARDHSIILLAAIEAGLIEEAKKGLEFILSVQKPSGEFLQRYDVDGNDASYKDLQIDGNGLVLFALGKYFDETNDVELLKKYWGVVEKAVNFVLQNKNNEVHLVHTVNSIHEYPAYEHGFEIYANASCCAGIEKAIKLGESIGKDVSVWKDEVEKLRESILTRLWNPRIRSFIKNIRIRHKDSDPLGYDEFASVVYDVDAVEYAPAYFGIIPDGDSKTISTVRRIDRELWDKELEGLNRYPEHWGRNNGGYGPWIHFTAQLAKHFVEIGDEDMALKYLNWCIDIAYDNKFPEHISTINRFELWLELYKNANILRDKKIVMIDNIKKHPRWKDGFVYAITPLLWPHAEYIRTYKSYKEKYL